MNVLYCVSLSDNNVSTKIQSNYNVKIMIEKRYTEVNKLTRQVYIAIEGSSDYTCIFQSVLQFPDRTLMLLFTNKFQQVSFVSVYS